MSRIEPAALEEKVKRILADRGIRMAVWGCGCCDSPEVRLEVDGESIVDDEDGMEFRFDMFEGEDDE